MAFHFRYRSKQPFANPLLSKPSVIIIAIVLFTILFSLFMTSSPDEQLLTLPEEYSPNICPSTHHQPVYIFLHMHKTAGNNLKQALFSFSTRNNLTLYHTCHPSVPDSPFSAWWFNRYKSTTSMDCNLDNLKALQPRNLSRINFVIGHQHHGVHTLFHPRPARYFTILRHPILRKTSHFLHFEPRNASISTYLISENLNYMTKHLATRAPASELALHFRARAIDIDPFAARAALSAAKGHLKHNFFFVGLHHRYSESICILSQILNVACRNGRVRRQGSNHQHLVHQFPMKPHRISSSKTNVRGNTIAVAKALPPHIWKKALQAESADLQLFRFAEQLFEAKLRQYEKCRQPRAGRKIAQRLRSK